MLGWRARGERKAPHQSDPVAAHARVVVEEQAPEQVLVEDDLLAQLGAVRRKGREAVREGRGGKRGRGASARWSTRITNGALETFETRDARIEVGVDERDRAHEGDGVVGLLEDEAHGAEQEGEVEELQAALVGQGRALVVSSSPSRVGERVHEGLDEVADEEDAAHVPQRRALDAGSEPDLEHAAEDVPPSDGVERALVGRHGGRRPADDLDDGCADSTLRELEDLGLLPERQVGRVVRVEAARRRAHRRKGAQAAVHERVDLLEERRRDEEVARCRQDDRGREEVEVGDARAQRGREEVRDEQTVVGAVEVERQVRVGRLPANDPARQRRRTSALLGDGDEQTGRERLTSCPSSRS